LGFGIWDLGFGIRDSGFGICAAWELCGGIRKKTGQVMNLPGYRNQPIHLRSPVKLRELRRTSLTYLTYPARPARY